MNKRLFVGNLPYKTTEDDLTELFSGVGEVHEVNIITDRNTGESRGFGFVEMEREDDAEEAIKQLNETKIGGREIQVNEAKPQQRR